MAVWSAEPSEIRRERIKAGLSLDEVALRLKRTGKHISRTELSRAERGYRDLTEEEQTRIRAVILNEQAARR
jgi:transcriptional regulator with XRE-family HTH domain